METYATDNSGSYAGATVAKLQAIEPTVPTGTAVAGKMSVALSGLSATGYTITVTAATTATTYSIVNSGGSLTFTCNVPTGNTTSGGCQTTSGVTGAGTWG
jgi:hypothetical protein